jgi:hypothetical protein
MTVLTGLGALAALAATVVLAAWLFGRRRATAVARRLGLRPAAHRGLRVAALAAAIVLLGLAAAQPALTHSSHPRERRGVQALFVLDISRSMAASATASSRTRLDRAIDAATTLRAAIADVPSGVATLTDRVLPDLLPVGGTSSFDAVLQRSVGVEQPPPADSGVRATSFTALDDIATGNYFAPRTSRKLIVLLSDGESSPVDTADLARALSPARGYRLIAVRTWRGGESVYGPTGKPEAGYRPDPAGRVVLADVARAVGGRAYEEAQLRAAASELRAAVGRGPATAAAAAVESRTPLAPYLAALALLLLIVATVPSNVASALHWGAREEGEASADAAAARRRARSGNAARPGGNPQRQP